MKLAIALTLVSLPLAFMQPQDQTPPDRVVDRMVELKSGWTIEGLGVCNVSADSAACWDMDGRPNADLTERMRAILLTNTNEIGFRYGKKNRILVVRRSAQQSGAQYTTLSGGYVNSISSNYSQNEPVIEWLRFSTEPEVQTGSIVASIYGWTHQGVDIPFRRGGKGTLDGMELEIASWGPEAKPKPMRGREFGGYPSSGMNDDKQAWWRVIFGVSGATKSSLGFSFIGKDGKPIRYVDAKGEPVPDTVVMKETPALRNYNPYLFNPNAKYRAAVMQNAMNGNLGGAMGYFVNVNPDRIKSIHVESSSQLRVQINGFPLDPK